MVVYPAVVYPQRGVVVLWDAIVGCREGRHTPLSHARRTHGELPSLSLSLSALPSSPSGPITTSTRWGFLSHAARRAIWRTPGTRRAFTSLCCTRTPPCRSTWPRCCLRTSRPPSRLWCPTCPSARTSACRRCAAALPRPRPALALAGSKRAPPPAPSRSPHPSHAWFPTASRRQRALKPQWSHATHWTSSEGAQCAPFKRPSRAPLEWVVVSKWGCRKAAAGGGPGGARPLPAGRLRAR